MSATTGDADRRNKARAAKAVAEIIEDMSNRPEFDFTWQEAPAQEQDEIRRTWEAFVLKAILASCCLLLCLTGCAAKPAPIVVDLAHCRVEAAHLLAYSARAPREDAPVLPEPDAGEPTPAELAEFGAPEKLNRIEQWIANSISSTVDQKLAKANLSWDEIRRMVATSERLRVWLDSFPAPKKQDGPEAAESVNPKVRCLFFHGPNCEPCERMKREFPKLKESGWKIGTEATADIQDCDCDAPACLPLRMRYLPKGSSLPVVVLVLPDGSEVGRKVGYVPHRELAEWINRTRNAHPEK